MVADNLKKRDRRLFIMGKPIKSLDILIKELRKNEWVIIRYGHGRDKPTCANWVVHMQFKIVVKYIEEGRICEAILNKRRIR